MNCAYTIYAYYGKYCDTQAEADSVYCELNPNDENCSVEKDTTLWACSESLSGGAVSSVLYRLSCKAKNGVVTSCNGKTDVDVTTDGELVRRMSGSCAANGYEQGVQSGDAATDSTGTGGDCIAVIGSDCYMRDARSGNTFTCSCDGSCNMAQRKLATGECVNPYPQNQQDNNDSLTFPPVSSEYLPPTSSASEPESAPSFGNEQDALNSLYGVVDTIRDTLNKAVVPSLRNIQANTQSANDYLQQIAAKEWSVNVEAPDVHVTNNTDVSGIQTRQDRQYDVDTAYQGRVLNALGALTDTAGQGNPNDTAGSGAALQGRLDAIDSVVNGYEITDMSDSIAPTVQAVRGDVKAMRDSIAGGVIGDSVNAWKNAFLDNGVLSGGGSNNCPAPLTRQVFFTFPHVGTIQAGSLGQYLCSPIAGFSVTLWQVARLLLRAMVAIGCMWWLFKEVTGTTTGGNDDD